MPVPRVCWRWTRTQCFSGYLRSAARQHPEARMRYFVRDCHGGFIVEQQSGPIFASSLRHSKAVHSPRMVCSVKPAFVDAVKARVISGPPLTPFVDVGIILALDTPFLVLFRYLMNCVMFMFPSPNSVYSRVRWCIQSRPMCPRLWSRHQGAHPCPDVSRSIGPWKVHHGRCRPPAYTKNGRRP